MSDTDPRSVCVELSNALGQRVYPKLLFVLLAGWGGHVQLDAVWSSDASESYESNGHATQGKDCQAIANVSS